jgi:hypothetical protein
MVVQIAMVMGGLMEVKVAKLMIALMIGVHQPLTEMAAQMPMAMDGQMKMTPSTWTRHSGQMRMKMAMEMSLMAMKQMIA